MKLKNKIHININHYNRFTYQENKLWIKLIKLYIEKKYHFKYEYDIMKLNRERATKRLANNVNTWKDFK